MKRAIQRLIRWAGYDLVRHAVHDPVGQFSDVSSPDRKIIERVQSYTMTSIDRLLAVIAAVRHLHQSKISGDIVECGVWRGGSVMAAALTLLECNDTGRQIYLYDTYEGMPMPTDRDYAVGGNSAAELLTQAPRGTGIWCEAALEDVQHNLFSTDYPRTNLHFVRGKVEDTIPQVSPEKIALLRLDTDWYESTRHELVHLYPRLAPGGVLIIDDYGHWQGARQATDEFQAALSTPLFLHRIDYTGRIAIKPGI